METFPILFGYKIEEKVRDLRQSGATQIVVALPWELIAPHEKQALINHSQSLTGLAGRGGLASCEACAVLEDRRWQRMGIAEANSRLLSMLARRPSTKGD